MPDDDDVPIFPPPKTDGPTLKQMYERDARSPWHRVWGGKTSPEGRAEAEARIKAALALLRGG